MSAVVLRAPMRPEFDLRQVALSVGVHASPEFGMCVMEGVSVVAGEPWSDRPRCASPLIGRFLRRWNDTLPFRPRQSLKRYVGAAVGTNTGADDEAVRATLVSDWLVRAYTPAWLGLAGLDEPAAWMAKLPRLTPSAVRSLRPHLFDVRRMAADRADGDSLLHPSVRKAARETGWDAAVAALSHSAGGGRQPAILDHSLVLDVALAALAAASNERLGRTAVDVRATTHEMLQELCAVGGRCRTGWSG